uniref:Mediator of RNA polymerase II transcription subunit 28 n=1 Tax=Rousettus aegyptiacus TaxID=9407 RepID=A0A7J8E8K4_ROUAE|nr:mediator complex subunit 28 [Rousettus aegyptiacus]
MAAPLGGMFSGQPPGPPLPPPGLPGQASLLQAAPGAPRSSPSTLVDELESSFEACFASLVSQDYVNGTDQEEIRTEELIVFLQKNLYFTVLISVSRNFWILRDRQNVFSYRKDCSYLSRNQNKLSKRMSRS